MHQQLKAVLLYFAFLTVAVALPYFFQQSNTPPSSPPTSEIFFQGVATRWNQQILQLPDGLPAVEFITNQKEIIYYSHKRIVALRDSVWKVLYDAKDAEISQFQGHKNRFLLSLDIYSRDSHSILRTEIYELKMTSSGELQIVSQIPYLMSENTYKIVFYDATTAVLMGLQEMQIVRFLPDHQFQLQYIPVLMNPAEGLRPSPSPLKKSLLLTSKNILYTVGVTKDTAILRPILELPSEESDKPQYDYPYHPNNYFGNTRAGVFIRQKDLVLCRHNGHTIDTFVFNSLVTTDSQTVPSTSFNAAFTASGESILLITKQGQLYFVQSVSREKCVIQAFPFNTPQLKKGILLSNDSTLIVFSNTTSYIYRSSKDSVANRPVVNREISFFSREFGTTGSFYGIGVGRFTNQNKDELYSVDIMNLNMMITRLDRLVEGIYLENEASKYGAEGIRESDEQDNHGYILDAGVTTGDINEDGYEDIIIANLTGSNSILLNNGSGYFRDVTKAFGFDQNMYRSERVILGDVNNDGYSDIFATSYLHSNRLFLNHYGVGFDEITESSRLKSDWGCITAAFCDINNDGYVDLYTGNWIKGNRLYLNNGDATFTDITVKSGTGCPLGTRTNSVVFADFNNDAYPDLFVGNRHKGNHLFLNNGDSTFTDITKEAGLDTPMLTYGAVAADLNTDGYLDMAIGDDDGVHIFKQNPGRGDPVFEDITRNCLIEDEGSENPTVSIASVDIDRNGIPDLIVSSTNGKLTAFLNKSESASSNKSVIVTVIGCESNRSGIGVKLSLYSRGHLIGYREIDGGNGYAGINSKTQIFGIPDGADSLTLIAEFPASGIRHEITTTGGRHEIILEKSGLALMLTLSWKWILAHMHDGSLSGEAFVFTLFLIIVVLSDRILFFVQNRRYLNRRHRFLLKVRYQLVAAAVICFLIVRGCTILWFAIFPDISGWIRGDDSYLLRCGIQIILATVMTHFLLMFFQKKTTGVNLQKLISELSQKLTGFYHGESAMMNLNRLSLYFKNPDTLSAESPDLLLRLEETIKEYREVTYPDIEEIRCLVKQFYLNTPFGSELPGAGFQPDQLEKSSQLLLKGLSHFVKAPQSEKPHVVSEIGNSMLQSISGIKKNMDILVKFVASNSGARIYEVVQSVFSAFHSDPESNISINSGDINQSFITVVEKAILRKCITIILKNALDACIIPDRHYTIQLEVQKYNSTLLLTVTDDADGISEELRDKLLKGNHSTKKDGHGFGLTYVKDALESYGGHITFTTETGKGTSFTLHLPEMVKTAQPPITLLNH